MAMVMLGMFALNPVGITGSIVQQLNHGISTGALFLLVGVVYERRHTREISEYGGLSKVMPVYAAVFLIMTMSSIGLPTLNGFIGEFLILQGVFVASKVWAAFAASGVVLGAAYMLYLYQRTMFGKIENPKNERLLDLSHREFATFAPLHRARGVDGALSGAVPAPARDVGAAHRRAREPAVRGEALPRRQRRRRRRPRGDRSADPAAHPCGPDGAAAVPTSLRRAGAGAKPAGRRQSRADAAWHLAQRLLLHPAGAGAHGRGAARAHRRRAAAARQRGAWRGSRCSSLGATLASLVPFRGHARRGRARADRRRSVRALLQGRLPRRRRADRADVGAVSRDRRREPRASTTS